MKLDGLFVDLYGTLTTGDRDAVEAVCQRVITDTGLSLTARELSVIWGERFFQALDRHTRDGFATLFAIEAATLHETLAEMAIALDPQPYVRDLSRYWQDPPLQADALEFLASCPYPLCIVSNADRADAEQTLRRHDIRPAALVTSEDARSYKPDAQIFADALRLTGWRRDQVMHVGDSLHSDVGGARGARLRSAWINRQHRIHDVGTACPDHEFPGLLELLQFLDSDDSIRRQHPASIDIQRNPQFLRNLHQQIK